MSEKDKKIKLFDAGLKLFNQYWIKKVSIDMIVKEAGVAKGTFYLYYKNKQELYEYIIFHILDVAKWKISQCKTLHSDIKSRLLYDFMWSYDFLQSYKIFHEILSWNELYFSWEINDEYLQNIFIDFLKLILQWEINEKTIDYKMLSRLIGLFNHLSNMQSCFKTKESFEQYKLYFAAIFIEGFFSDYKTLANTFDKEMFTKLMNNK